MGDLSDFDFKSHLAVFRVIVDDVAIGDVPIGALEHFLLCILHCNRNSKIRITLVSGSEG